MNEHNNTVAEAADTASSALLIATEGKKKVGESLRLLLADFFTLYFKTKNFHWHMMGPHFREYHLLLDEQATELFDATDAIAERSRKIGETTLRSIGDVSRYQRLSDSNTTDPLASTMLRCLGDDNVSLANSMRQAMRFAKRRVILLRRVF